MQGTRPARVGDQIREELSELLSREVKDPGIGFITITHVKVSADLQVARAFYTLLGDAAARKATAKALDRALPFLRRQIAGRLRLRRAPELIFQYDESVEKHQRIEAILLEIKAAERSAAEEAGDAAPGVPPAAVDASVDAAPETAVPEAAPGEATVEAPVEATADTPPVGDNAKATRSDD